MGNLIQNEYARNAQQTVGNLTGLSSAGSQLVAEKREGFAGKIATGHGDENKVLDVNSAFEELKNNKAVFVRTADGREVKITSLEQLKALNLSDPVAGMGAQSRNQNMQASYYNSFTPFWWPKMGATQVAPDGSHLDQAGYTPFMPAPPRFGAPGGWFPYGG